MALLFLIQQNNPAPLVTRQVPEKKDNIVSVSSLVEEQLPHFVRVDHPRTVAFMEAYYEWMEEKSETLYSAFILHEYKDIDETIEEFVRHFRIQYMDRFPKDLAIDKSTGAKVDEKRLIKRIKQFYGAKGTEKAYRLLFRILYDTEIEFYYPKKDIIKSSHGKWIQEKSLKLTSSLGTSGGTSGKIWNTPETIVTQKDASGKFIAEAKISTVRVYETALTNISEIFLNDINGIFKTDVPVTFENNFSEVPYPLLQGVSVNIDAYGNKERGRGYKTGDKVTVTSSVTGGVVQGLGAKGIVNSVTTEGGIITIELQDGGLGYRHDSGATFDYAIESLTGTGAGLTSTSGAMFDNPGYFFDANGHPSSTKHLQDSFFYQDYSYEINTEITLETYKQAVVDLIHPAGTKLFNRIFIRKHHPTNTTRETSVTAYDISTCGHYLPYTFNTVENLRYNTTGTDLYPFGYNPSVATADDDSSTAHQAGVARSRVYWGLVFNDEPGRTAQSDGYTLGNTYAFDAYGSSGNTWDPGTTGPLYHLSQGIVMNYGLSGASSAYEILATAEAGDFTNQGSYWVIYPHPNSRGLNTIPSGTTFSDVKLEPFFHMTYPGGYTNSTGGIMTTSETVHGIVLQ
jgi:hypothetical protein